MVSIKKLETLLKNKDRNAERRKQRSYSNIDIFNRWRRWRKVKDWLGLDLEKINLIGADLRGINFENVRLYDAKLGHANFENANLRRAVFDYTSAREANFKNADFRGCLYLYKLSADGANFEDADFRGAYLDKRYKWYVWQLLQKGRFSKTRIMPEQKKQLIKEFKVPKSDFNGRFKVTLRSKYRSPNSWFAKKALREHKRAEEEGRIFTEELNGNSLEYAVISTKGNEDLYDVFGYAFSMCKSEKQVELFFGSDVGQYAGKWQYFVFDTVPEKFREFAAVHEFGEREGGNHTEAMKMEYSRAKSKGVLKKYFSWILRNRPNILISNMLLAEGGEETMPREVIGMIKKSLPEDIEVWKKEYENRKRGLQPDIWQLAWRKGGLNDRQIYEALKAKGYNVSLRMVRYYRKKMEIPNYRAIKKLTFLEPL